MALGSSVEDLFGAAAELPVFTARLAADATGPARFCSPMSTVHLWPFRCLGTSGSLRAFDRPSHMRSSRELLRQALVSRSSPSRPRDRPWRYQAAILPSRCWQALLERHRPPASLLWWSCNNTASRALLATASVHAVAVHRRASYELARPEGQEVVGFAGWREGLVVSAEHAGTVKDLNQALELGLRLVNREPGSEARRLLDEALEP